MAVYHKYAKCPPYVDEWSRLHVHGLNPMYLMEHGFEDEAALTADFKQWIQHFNVTSMYANGPPHEFEHLNMTVYDMGLPKWVDRYYCDYHQIPQRYKLSGIPFHGILCDSHVHREYVHQFSRRCRTPTDKVKALHGYHCSLADAHELYLFYMKSCFA